MPKYYLKTLTKETGIVGRLTRLGLPNEADRARIAGMVSQAVNGSARVIDVRWGTSIRLFGHDEIYIELEVSSPMSENDVKGATVSAIQAYWGGPAPVEVTVVGFRVISFLDEMVGGALTEPFIQYLVLGVSSGFVIGVIAFGLFRALKR